MKYCEGVNVHDRSELKNLPLFIKTDTAAAIANVCDKYIRNMCINGEIKARKVGNKSWRVDRDAFLDYLGMNE